MSGPTHRDRYVKNGGTLCCHKGCTAVPRARVVATGQIAVIAANVLSGPDVCLRHALFWERRGLAWNPNFITTMSGRSKCLE